MKYNSDNEISIWKRFCTKKCQKEQTDFPFVLRFQTTFFPIKLGKAAK